MTMPRTRVEEARRLETLRGLGLLDTGPEERFDRVTRLAGMVLGAPMAFLSLIDAQRQWLKSRQGLEALESDREDSFCSHAIKGDRIFVVNDAADDERFRENPLVVNHPKIRFYAGCPISAPDASKIGALGVLDRKPRTLSEEEAALLRELGRIVENELTTSSPSTSDAGTGFSNRRGLSLFGKYLLATCRRAKRPAALIFVRFTNLASIDESFGYSVGDAAVIELAELLKRAFEGADLIGRATIDSFGILLADPTLADMRRTCEQLSSLVEARNAGERDYALKLRTDHVRYCPARHPDVEQMLREAEDRLDNPPFDAVLERLPGPDPSRASRSAGTTRGEVSGS